MYLYGTSALQNVPVSRHVRSAEITCEVWLQWEYHSLMLRALPRIPFSKKEHGKNTRECWSGIAHACDLRRMFLVDTKASIALVTQ